MAAPIAPVLAITGTANPGNPDLLDAPAKIGGTDGVSIRTIVTIPGFGNLAICGAAVDGGASVGYPVFMAGKGDDSNIHSLNVNPQNQLYVISEGRKRTYSVGGLITPATAATDILNLSWVSGTVKLLFAQLTFTATAAGVTNALLIKRSTANSGGSSTTPALVPNLSSDAAANSVLTQYSGNPTTGTSLGTIKASKVGISAASGMAVVTWDFTRFNDKAPTLISANQSLSVNLNGDTLITGELVAYSMIISEE